MAVSLLWRIAFAVRPETAEALADALEPFCVSVSWYEVTAKDWRVEGIAAAEPDRDAVVNALGQAAWRPGIPAPRLHVAPVPPADWAAANLSTFKPVTVGRYFVHGSHFKGVMPPGRIALALDAGMAFGSGEHATTAGCLAVLDDLARRRRFSNVLDLGCGSGILAFAMARTWPAWVLAVDIDPEAVAVARENARRNRLAPRIRFAVGNGMTAPLVRARAPYDLIVANILARPLVRMAGAVASALTSGGIAVFSGLIAADAPWVESAARTHGLGCIRRVVRDGWATLVLRRGRG